MWWTGSNLFISSGKRTRECAVKLRRTRETKSSHFLSSTLLSRLLSRATRAWFLSIFLKWRDWSSAVTVFIMVRDGCIVIIMAQSIPRLPIPPKHLSVSDLLWLSTSEQERVCSQTRQFLLLLRDLSPIIRNWKIVLWCFKMLKMLRHSFVQC